MSMNRISDEALQIALQIAAKIGLPSTAARRIAVAIDEAAQCVRENAIARLKERQPKEPSHGNG